MAIMYVLASVGSYALTSFLFLHNPQLIHKPKASKKCRHISHRGGAGENYENTLAAFTHAVYMGTDMLEVDCHLTKDKQVVVAHDSCLHRTTGENAYFKDLHYDQLPLLKTCIKLDFGPGKEFCGLEDENLRKIPLLKDVFEAFPNVQVNIDVKEGSDELIEQIDKLIKEYKREKLTVWGSFKEDSSLKCYNQNPEVGRYFSLKGVVKLYLYFYTGLLPFISFKETHLEIPLFTRDTSTLSRVQRLVVRMISVLIARPALFRHLKRRGIPVYVWVLNTEQDFERAVKLGVDGIMTDYPTKLKQFLSTKSP